MELTKQVCSLELAKKLKELGVKQESYFSWDVCSTHPDGILVNKGDLRLIGCEWLSAFTVAELGEMLPKQVGQIRGNGVSKTAFWLSISFDETSNKWRYSYANHRANECIEMLFAGSEADARAEMLVYLLENKLLIL